MLDIKLICSLCGRITLPIKFFTKSLSRLVKLTQPRRTYPTLVPSQTRFLIIRVPTIIIRFLKLRSVTKVVIDTSLSPISFPPLLCECYCLTNITKKLVHS